MLYDEFLYSRNNKKKKPLYMFSTSLIVSLCNWLIPQMQNLSMQQSKMTVLFP